MYTPSPKIEKTPPNSSYSIKKIPFPILYCMYISKNRNYKVRQKEKVGSQKDETL